jgi:hypothetical protein
MNLDCAYCNEYDKTSAPVPLETMLRRIDRLADLGTSIITLSGGEPTLHPELDAIIHHVERYPPRGGPAQGLRTVLHDLLRAPDGDARRNFASVRRIRSLEFSTAVARSIRSSGLPRW